MICISQRVHAVAISKLHLNGSREAEVRVYNKALPQAEVASIAQVGLDILAKQRSGA